jgi:SAM-dependent methyltransferase
VDHRSPWNRAETVAGFAQSPPNDTLMAFAAAELGRLGGHGLAVDIGCGAGRNAVPLAESGWNVFGVDLSLPMLSAAHERARALPRGRRFDVVRASMDALPLRDRCGDLVIAHGVWNLARTARAMRAAVAEAARVSKPGAALFVFTFSRHTLPPDAVPVEGEPFVYTDFSGEPQCFLAEDQLLDEMRVRGFQPDDAVPLREHNLPKPGALRSARVPVIYEAAFRFRP